MGLESELDQKYFELTLVAAVARAIQPGCKKDEIWVLHGEQGIGKSTFCRALVPDNKLFTDCIEWEKFNQDTKRQLNRNWIVECPEISTINKPNKLKQFLTTQVDEFRQWWTPDFVVLPRRSIIIGTTNDQDLLTDVTGNRRFWISSIPRNFTIPIEDIDNCRDDMWCAAIDLFNQLSQTKEKWSLPADLESEQKIRNKIFSPDNHLKFTVQKYLLEMFNKHLKEDNDKDSFFTSVYQIRNSLFDSSSNKLDKQITKILRELGFRCTGERMRLSGIPIRTWKPYCFDWIDAETK